MLLFEGSGTSKDPVVKKIEGDDEPHAVEIKRGEYGYWVEELPREETEEVLTDTDEETMGHLGHAATNKYEPDQQ